MGNCIGENIWCAKELDNEITIERLIKQLDEFNDYGIAQYEITEDFNKIGRHTYNVHNLEASIVDVEDYIMFDDMEHIIVGDTNKVLMMFTVGNLLKIEYNGDKSYKAVLIFKDGTITIERIENVQL